MSLYTVMSAQLCDTQYKEVLDVRTMQLETKYFVLIAMMFVRTVMYKDNFGTKAPHVSCIKLCIVEQQC